MDSDIKDRLYAICTTIEGAIEKTEKAWGEALDELKKVSARTETNLEKEDEEKTN